MKILSRLMLIVVALTTAFALAASDLPVYAPKDTNIILFANLNRIAHSRLVQKILQEDPGLKQQRDNFARSVKEATGLDWDEMLNSELCIFGTFTQKDTAFQILAYSNSGKAAEIFEFCVQSAQDDKSENKSAVGEVNGLRIIRDKNTALLLLDSRTLQFSYSDNPANVLTAPIAKNDPSLAQDVDTGAFLSIAVDLENFNMPDDVRNDATLKDILHDLVKIAFNFSENGDTLKLVSIATYRNEKSAAAALAASRKLTELLKDAAKDSAHPGDSQQMLLQKLTDSDQYRADGVRLIGTSTIDTALALELFHAINAEKK